MTPLTHSVIVSAHGCRLLEQIRKDMFTEFAIESYGVRLGANPDNNVRIDTDARGFKVFYAYTTRGIEAAQAAFDALRESERP